MLKTPFSLSILALLMSLNCLAQNQSNMKFQNDPYTGDWAIIDSLEASGLPKSALEKVDSLFAKAKKENNPTQIVKSLIYKGKYINQLEEDGLVKAIFQFESETDSASFPARPILQSMLAEIYKNYLNNHIWEFQNRTKTVNFKPDDIRTWDISRLYDKSSELYLLSIQDDQLKKINISEIDAITFQGQNDKGLRTTLYDFLVNRCLDYFADQNPYLTEPVYKFFLDQPAAFAPAADFVNLSFQTADSTSYKLRTLHLFQQLIRYHLNDEDPSNLLDIDFKRLDFVHTNGVMQGKDSLYEAALLAIEKQFQNNPAVSEAMFKRAELYKTKGDSYRPNPDNIGKWDFKTANDICDSAIKLYPGSFGATNCAGLQAELHFKTLSLQTEKINIPDKPILGLINFRNVDSAFLKVIPINDVQRKEIEKIEYNSILSYFQKLKPLKTWNEALPLDGDLKNHTAECKIDKLPIGYYVLIISDNKNFSSEGGAVNYLYINVSNIAYWQRLDEHNLTEFVVMNRTTGEPLEGVAAEFYVSNYNEASRKYETKKTGNGVSNKDGFIYPRLNKNTYFQVKFSLGKDTLFTTDSYSNYAYENPPKHQAISFFFLDRAIYRPGQTVFFKTLVIEKDDKGMPKILPNQDVDITFYDANYQEVKKLSLKTNAFGSVNGSFTAPATGLLGQMHLESNIGNNQVYFSVEEYKRPKFEVTFKPIEGSFRLGDRVKVTGSGQAFAGSNIDGAKVTYRVVRGTRFPYIPWWYWKGWNPWVGNEMEITNGTTTTDAKGEFNVEFELLPDKSVPADKKPEFVFTIYADVTDINGETHSSETTVTAGFIALSIDIVVPEQVNRKKAKPFAILSQNLNGQFERARGQITIWQLDSPKRTFHERYWERPDTFLMDKGQFIKSFPNYPYKDEDLVQNWKKDKQVYKDIFDTGNRKELVIDTIPKWEPGNYLLRLKTEDAFGQPIEITKYFTLYDRNDKVIAINKVFWDDLEKESFEPGDTVRYYIGTAEERIKVLMEIERGGIVENSQWVDIKGLDKIKFKIEEADRGNIYYRINFVKNNRAYHFTKTLIVPWTNKELSFEYQTFRDKLQPGKPEEWRIKISGLQKDKMAAEMVAAMYDASLDQFVPNNWGLDLYPSSYPLRGFTDPGFGSISGNVISNNWQQSMGYLSRTYKTLNWFNFNFYEGYYGNTRMRMMDGAVMAEAPVMKFAAPAAGFDKKMKDGNEEIAKQAVASDEISLGLSTTQKVTPPPAPPKTDFSQVKIRKNLNETVFFMPDLMTDAEGNVILKFTMNEALTKWKFLGMAHTKDLKYGLTDTFVVTQKDLMILPNPPRFVRENDFIVFSAKISNLSATELKGTAVLQLYDALTMQAVDTELGNSQVEVPFVVPAGQSTPVEWNLNIPVGKVQALTYRILAKAGDFSDGEENSLPVLTNRMLVTETLPLPVRGGQTKEFTLQHLKDAGQSNTLQSHKMTLEFTSNPAWYAVQALPYLMEYPYDCTEQIFNRYYANSLATSVANAHPKIKEVFEKWKNAGAGNENALLSNLNKNQELKSALLEETPWVLASQKEEEQKKNIALLFDLNRMASEQQAALDKIAERQLGNGGFAWFPGGIDSWYITQYLVEGMGHLQKLGVKDVKSNPATAAMLKKAISYCDARIVESYKEIEKHVKAGEDKWENDHLYATAIHYLYTRTFFLDQTVDGDAKTAFDYFMGQADKYWLNKGIYQEGMIALALYRNNNTETPAKIIASLKENSLNSEEMGMYWKYDYGYFWYQLPIETQSLMIEAFSEVAKDEKAVDDLKVWLLKNKQTSNWKTTKATSSAVYALLSNGDNWLLDDQPVNITIGSQLLDQSHLQKEAGTGYFKTSWDGNQITPEMGSIKVENPNKVVAWGGLYWQYFEQLDKIKDFKETPLTLVKQLFRVENTPTGPVITPITDKTMLNTGDQVKVRIELRVDRPMEYVHMKDMRASGFEPMNVFSQYKWQDGLGYYESTRDASTNFFFDYLPRGTYVFEYPLRVSQRGDFSNGITTIQCMYAPEFSSHSEGIRVTVK